MIIAVNAFAKSEVRILFRRVIGHSSIRFWGTLVSHSVTDFHILHCCQEVTALDAKWKQINDLDVATEDALHSFLSSALSSPTLA